MISHDLSIKIEINTGGRDETRGGRGGRGGATQERARGDKARNIGEFVRQESTNALAIQGNPGRLFKSTKKRCLCKPMDEQNPR